MATAQPAGTKPTSFELSALATLAGKTVDPAAAGRVGKIKPQVSEVAGVLYSVAEATLSKSGYEPKAIFLGQPDPSLRYGYVRLTSPVAAHSWMPAAK